MTVVLGNPSTTVTSTLARSSIQVQVPVSTAGDFQSINCLILGNAPPLWLISVSGNPNAPVITQAEVLVPTVTNPSASQIVTAILPNSVTVQATDTLTLYAQTYPFNRFDLASPKPVIFTLSPNPALGPGNIFNIWTGSSSGNGTASLVPPVPTIQPVWQPLENVVSWGNVQGATSYDLQRSTPTAGGFTTIAGGLTATSFTDQAIQPGTAYYYRVVAHVPTGQFTSGIGAAYSAGPLPVTPTLVQLDPLLGQNMMGVWWPPSYDGAGGASTNTSQIAQLPEPTQVADAQILQVATGSGYVSFPRPTAAGSQIILLWGTIGGPGLGSFNSLLSPAGFVVDGGYSFSNMTAFCCRHPSPPAGTVVVGNGAPDSQIIAFEVQGCDQVIGASFVGWPAGLSPASTDLTIRDPVTQIRSMSQFVVAWIACNFGPDNTGVTVFTPEPPFQGQSFNLDTLHSYAVEWAIIPPGIRAPAPIFREDVLRGAGFNIVGNSVVYAPALSVAQ